MITNKLNDFISIFSRNSSPYIKPLDRTVYIFGTIANFRLYGIQANKAIEETVQRLNEIDDKISVFKQDSEISRINFCSGELPQKVSKDTLKLIRNAVKYSEISEGTFDPTIRPLTALWQIGTENAHVPSKEKISENLRLVDYKSVIIDDKTGTVGLIKKGQSIDLGGIAKGYAADEAADIFKKHKIKNAIIDLGGNILVVGKKIDGSQWRVGVQNPFRQRGTFIGVLSLEDKSVVTSGNYERYFEENGKRYHHIIDPKTGYPCESDIVSATIISDKSIDGDGLSTGIYILGVEKAMDLIEKMNGIDAILITKNKEVYVSSGVREKFKLTDSEYIYVI